MDLAETRRDQDLAARFVRRVLSPSERVALARSPDPERQLWRLWAAKEAAFKAMSPALPALRFDHARFEVEHAGASGRVRHPDFEVAVRWTETEDWVHAIAFADEPARWLSEVASLGDIAPIAADLAAEELASTPHADSRAARALAHRLLGRMGAPDDLLLIRTGAATAVRRRASCPHPWRVSLSHDGRFVSALVAEVA